jgi:ubiquinone/menaquinone biosynthesis C-methylase UbiE
MLNQARNRSWAEGKVTFQTGDAYELEVLNGEFDAGLTAFWFSHVSRTRVVEFLDGFHRRLSPGSPVFIADNMPVPGVGGELVTFPDRDDTFKRRELGDGSEHLVLKNYYSEQELETLFRARSSSLEIHMGKCFWWIVYRVMDQR